jgi:hypothetical protein
MTASNKIAPVALSRMTKMNGWSNEMVVTWPLEETALVAAPDAALASVPYRPTLN